LSKAPAYRNDIDGIRAFAVLSVLAFHLGFPMSGGYIGVDVFFVLSGFLIGSHIYEAAMAGEFSFLDFYQRRAKRILPALLAVMVATSVVMLLVATPSELEDFAKTAISCLLSASNIYLYKSIDYFNPTAEQNPLLMTWSLGVEEQFYIFAPFVLLALVKVRAALRRPAIALMLLGSLAIAVWKMRSNPLAAFYLLPPRAWELGAGVWLGVWNFHHPEGVPTRWRGLAKSSVLAMGAAMLILVPAFLYTARTPFPGVAAIAPVLGTVLLLFTKDSAFNRRVLGGSVMRFFGLISYSLYLWHWPLISLSKVVMEQEPSVAWRAALFGASVVLAWLSYKFVETPFRQTTTSAKRSLQRYSLALVSMGAIIAIAIPARGFESRWPSAFVTTQHRLGHAHDPCLAGYGSAAPNVSKDCVLSPAESSGAPIVVLVGDSHASALKAGIQAAAQKSGMHFEEMTKSSCPFLLNVSRSMTNHPKHLRECAAFNQQVLERIKVDENIRTVVIAGFWRVGLEEDGPYAGIGAAAGTPAQLLHQGLFDIVSMLNAAGKRVVVVQDVPYMRVIPSKRDATCSNGFRQFVNGVPRGDQRCESALAGDTVPDPVGTRIVAEAAAAAGAVVFDPTPAFCRAGACRFKVDQDLLYVDRQHLSEAGAVTATRGIEQWLAVPH